MAWLDRFQRRHRWAAFPIGVLYKFFDDQGSYLAALITYYGFVSLFPLLLLLASILGFVLSGDPDLQNRILDSAIGQFPIVGTELGRPGGLQGNTAAVLVGAIVAIYGALGVAQALQHAMNTMWAVPRNRRPNPLLSRLRGLVLLGLGGLTVLATTVLNTLGSAAEAVFDTRLDRGVTLLAAVAAVVLNTAVFVVAFRLATARALEPGQVLRGAVLAALFWQLLQRFGKTYAERLLDDTSLYGAFAFVLGLLAWLYLAALGVVLAAEVNVVRAKRLYPRALLTPFTDDVQLTPADETVYTDVATAQRLKGVQTIEVSFTDPTLEIELPDRHGADHDQPDHNAPDHNEPGHNAPDRDRGRSA
ncbi:MAG: YihY/virulence factor BrkB family protein [Acidimicrobiales bacterium]|nr:YihY/virulence factor BrkB family protein [Acidimicrobiales bacterium]